MTYLFYGKYSVFTDKRKKKKKIRKFAFMKIFISCIKKSKIKMNKKEI